MSLKNPMTPAGIEQATFRFGLWQYKIYFRHQFALCRLCVSPVSSWKHSTDFYQIYYSNYAVGGDVTCAVLRLVCRTYRAVRVSAAET